MSIDVMGIDPSLTSTGVVIVRNVGIPSTWRIQTKGKASDKLTDTIHRLRVIRTEVATIAEIGQPDLVVIEGPSHGSNYGKTHERAGLWWSIVDAIELYTKASIVIASPHSRAKYATGRGNAGKDEVLAAVVKRYQDTEVTGNDIADALVLAAMGLRHLGKPLELTLPQANLDAMAGVDWP